MMSNTLAWIIILELTLVLLLGGYLLYTIQGTLAKLVEQDCAALQPEVPSSLDILTPEVLEAESPREVDDTDTTDTTGTFTGAAWR